MKCYFCSKNINGTGSQYTAQYRLMILQMHIHEDCKKDKFDTDALFYMLKVRENGGYDNSKMIAKLYELSLKMDGYDVQVTPIK